MGRLNAMLIRACEQARKQHGADSLQCKKAARAVDRSQAECLHDGEIRTGHYREPDPKAGQAYRFCMDCSKVL